MIFLPGTSVKITLNHIKSLIDNDMNSFLCKQFIPMCVILCFALETVRTESLG